MNDDIGLLAMAEVRKHPERYRGEAGDQGQKGDRGPKGEKGDRGSDGSKGDPGFEWRGAWKAATQYQPGDVVEFEGSSYVATAAGKGRKPTSGSWDLVAQKGEPGEPGRRGGSGAGAGSALAVKDEGVSLDAAVTSIDFAGTGVTATAVGHAITVTVPGGSGIPQGGPLTQDLDADGSSLVYGGAPPGADWNAIAGASDGAATGATVALKAADDSGDGTGGTATLQGGTSPGGITGGYIIARGGNDADGEGAVLIETSSGSGGAAEFHGNSATEGGRIELLAGGGGAGDPGGELLLSAGSGDNGNDDPASITLAAGDGSGNAGRAEITTNGTTGGAGHLLTAQGDDTALWVAPSFDAAGAAAAAQAASDPAGSAATAAAASIAKTFLDAKGDLISASADNTPSLVTVGANDTILMADSVAAAGLKWVASQTPTTQAFSDAAAQGSADTYARGDHLHGMPASPAATVTWMAVHRWGL